MHQQRQRPLRYIILIGFFLNVAAVSPSYYIMTPNLLIPGVDTKLAVHWFGNNYSEINVTASIIQNDNFLVNVSSVFHNDSVGILSLPAVSLDPWLSYQLAVVGSAQKTILFNERKPMEIERMTQSVFIQTNKPIYKPGEIVKIRVICLDHDLKPHSGYVTIFIMNPRGIIIQQWMELKADMGVTSVEFLLSKSTIDGSWVIQAQTNNASDFAVISVIQYESQRFEVKLDTPSYYISSKKQNLTAKVTAKYNKGNVVNGNVTIILRPDFNDERADIIKAYTISGSINLSFTYQEIANLLASKQIQIIAIVTEEQTGVKMTAFSVVKVYGSEYILQTTNTQPFFFPGTNFTEKIQILRADNKNLLKEEREKNISIKIEQLKNIAGFLEINSQEEKQYAISESGMVKFEIPVLESTNNIFIQALYENATLQQALSSATELNIDGVIRTPESPIQVGTPFQIHVDTFSQLKDLFYVVCAKGLIVATGKETGKSFILTPEYSWGPSVVLTVYFHNFNYDITQYSKALSINGFFRNKVSLSWSKSKAGPGETISLSVNVKEANSVVGLKIIEKRADLLGEGNDLTTRKVTTLFENINQRRSFKSITDGNLRASNHFMSDPVQNRPLDQAATYFPETWIWLETNISSNINKILQFTVPDTNTTWVASAFVVSERLGLGVTDEPVELQVLKSFFIALNMPYSITRGEEFILEVTVFNNLAETMQVVVTLESSDSFIVIVANKDNDSTVAGKQKVTVPSQDGKTVLFPIKPIKLGEITINVTADSSATSATKSQTIFVNAEGVKNYYSQTTLLEPSLGKAISQNLSFTFPSDVVSGSQEAYITVIGDLLGPSIDGLASLIQMPYGCGEQNMINFAPNVYVLQYLMATKQVRKDIWTQAITYIETGYQKELTYMRDDGSFSAFGKTDASGSSWLSAFVIKCFLQAQQFTYINPTILDGTITWLLQYQDANTGIFSEPGVVYHSELQGGLNGPVTLTAYIVIAFLEDPHIAILHGSKIQKSVQYLESKFDDGISSNYTLSIVAYALSLANSTKANAALSLLNSKANNIEGTKFWSLTLETASYYWQPRTTDIETSAYALLSHYRQNRINEGIPIMKWLSQQRNHLGGYASTQDTIVALQALSQFSVTSIKDTALTVTVTGKGSFIPKSFQITKDNLLVLQSHQIQVSQPLDIKVSAEGKGMAIVQFNIVYNKKPSSRRKRNTVFPEAFKLDVTVEDKNNTALLSVVICASTADGHESGMVLLEVGYLSGFTLEPTGIPITWNLKMVEKKDDKVYLYFDSITATKVCVTVPMIRTAKVAASQDAVVRISDYYNPRNTVTRTYNSKTMTMISTCDFCGFNCSKCKSNVLETSTPTSSASSPEMLVPLFFTLCIYYLLTEKYNHL